MKWIWTGMAMLLWVAMPAAAGEFNDADALRGLKEVRIVADVNVGKPKLLLRRLELIDDTYTQLIDAGVTPTIVVAFRGGATKFVTHGDGYVPADQQGIKKEVQGWISQFAENGLVLEQCAIAARGQKVKAGDILPSIKVVQNGYISLIGYQNRGYALLPMD